MFHIYSVVSIIFYMEPYHSAGTWRVCNTCNNQGNYHNYFHLYLHWTISFSMNDIWKNALFGQAVHSPFPPLRLRSNLWKLFVFAGSPSSAFQYFCSSVILLITKKWQFNPAKNIISFTNYPQPQRLPFWKVQNRLHDMTSTYWCI